MLSTKIPHHCSSLFTTGASISFCYSNADYCIISIRALKWAILHKTNPSFLCKKSPQGGISLPLNTPQTEADFYACQTRLQTEARLALAQAKDLARLHMEMERQKRHVSPITEMLRTTLLKVMYVVGSTLKCK